MRLRISVSISGEGFDPYEFRDHLPAGLEGTAKPHKGKPRGKNGERTHYWTSIEIDGGEGIYLEKSLYALIEKYRDYIEPISHFPNIKKYLSIFCYPKELSELHGFFFDNKLIEICNELGIEIDVGLSG